MKAEVEYLMGNRILQVEARKRVANKVPDSVEGNTKRQKRILLRRKILHLRRGQKRRRHAFYNLPQGVRELIVAFR